MTEKIEIPDKHKNTLKLLELGLATDNVSIMKCKDRKTGVDVWCLMIHKPIENSKGFYLAPLAKLFEGDPCIEMQPPEDVNEGGGYGHN